MSTKEQIDAFFTSKAFGVVGASADRHKYGNKVLRVYQQKNLKVVPVNPREQEIEGVACVASVMDLPDEVTSISVITPPKITEEVVEMAARKGIRTIWMQPGAESDKAVELCRQSGIAVIADGSCILVVLGYRDH
ncbi:MULTISPECIES: CoA-binding protein [Geobacter]|uniref:CoA-binding protein n=1 Tax=Geobacter TaxID=28231 RepID=UPI0025735D3E|nr:CoA-binding protein [Geobacter sulfurreducens]BEH10405.1 CoA-binding protein [Geobacter sulfurreducens subsp. ethanolicus]BET58008.1 CoA-binding protein [Geobacter sp. 60473]